MKKNYSYFGLFVDAEELFEKAKSFRSSPLEHRIKHPHVTFAHYPESVDEALFGYECEITAAGYGNDGKNEGLLVKLHIDDERLAELAEKITVPHITLAIAEGETAVNTKHLEFEPIEEITFKGIFGGFNIRLKKPVLKPDK